MATKTKSIQTNEYNLTAEDVQFKCPDGMNAKLTEFRELENAILLRVVLDGKTYCGWPLKAIDSFAPVKVEKRKKRPLKINKLPLTLNGADGKNTPKKPNIYDREIWPKGYVDIRNTVEEKLRFGRDKKISFHQGSDSQGKDKTSSHFKKCRDSPKSDSQNKSNYIERKKILNDNSPINQFKKRGRPSKNKSYKEYLAPKATSEENFQSSYSGFGFDSLECSSSNDSGSLSVRFEGKKITLDDSFSYSPERILNYSLEEIKLPSVINKLQTERAALSKSIQVSTEDLTLSFRKDETAKIAVNSFHSANEELSKSVSNKSNYTERKKILNDYSPFCQFKKRGRPPKKKMESYKEYLAPKATSEENFPSYSGFGIESSEYSSSNDSASLSVRYEGKKTALDESFSYSPQRIPNYSLEENKLPSVTKLQIERAVLSKSIQVSTEDDLTHSSQKDEAAEIAINKSL